MADLHARIPRERLDRHLAYHEKMSRMFRENRFMFEIEKRKAVEKIINNARTTDSKNRLTRLQEKWDTTIKHSGSNHNRLVLAEMMMWDFVRDIWLPALQGETEPEL